MASFCFLLFIIMASLVSLCCSSDHHHHHTLKMDIIPSTLSSPTPSPAPAPAVSPATYPPSTELSPDIAPLLPSSGGVVPSPTSSSSSSHHVPTIPSNPSPPKPEDDVSVGPDSAFAPFGSSLVASSALNLTPMGYSRILNFFSYMTHYYIGGMFIIFLTANCIPN